jgi:hypothetical protein
MDFEDPLRSYRSQDKVTCRISIGQNVTEPIGMCGFYKAIRSFTLVMVPL